MSKSPGILGICGRENETALLNSTASPQINAASFAQMANSALKWSSHLPMHAKAQEQIQEALGHLPGDKHAEMLLVKEELDAVAREAAAADAAVAAVAKVGFNGSSFPPPPPEFSQICSFTILACKPHMASSLHFEMMVVCVGRGAG